MFPDEVDLPREGFHVPEKRSHVDEWASLLDERVLEEALADETRPERPIDLPTRRHGN